MPESCPPRHALQAWAFSLAFLLLCPASAHAASPTISAAPRAPLRLFLDCDEAVCDFAYLKQQLTWVDWVRDRRDADVYVLATTRETGSGGTEGVFYVTRPHGGGPAADTLRIFVREDASDEASRQQLLRALQSLLVRDLAERPEGARLEIGLRPEDSDNARAAAAPALDHWHDWVLRLAGDGSFSGQRTFRDFNTAANASASRVVERSKVSLSAYYNYSELRFETPHFVGVQRGWGGNARAVASLGARWSLGARAFVSSSRFLNQHLVVGAGPALEYDVYPYAESARHLFTIAYGIELRRVRYDDTTLYGRTRELLGSHALSAKLALAQPWGTIALGPAVSQYLHDTSKYRLTLSAEAELHLVRGFSLSLSSFAARVHDLLSLPRGSTTDDDVLLQQHQLATSYQLSATLGISYTFGSRTNNVVNPRLRDVYGAF